jgi:ribosomal protein S18 acetylase RimI-like enzyme
VDFETPKKKNAHEIAKLHIDVFPNFFLSTLGTSFLTTYYKSCLKSKESITICAVDRRTKKILGFAIGCINSKGFNKRLIFSNLNIYIYEITVLIFTKPLAIIRLIKNLKKGNNLMDKGNYAELFSIGVSPNYGGLGIGKQLLYKFETQVKNKGVNTITLTTDLDSNDGVLNFYKKGGYKFYYEFITYPNRKMIKFLKHL